MTDSSFVIFILGLVGLPLAMLCGLSIGRDKGWAEAMGGPDRRKAERRKGKS